MQKTEAINEKGCRCEDRVEPDGRTGVQSATVAEVKVGDSVNANLMDKLLSKENLNKAYRQVKRNGGAPGIDKMTVEEALPYLREHGEEIKEKIRKGLYHPQAVRRVEIDKPDGGVRLLGVPTVVDRVFQQALAQVLTPIFEPTFSDSSYGFRPGRDAHQAIEKAKGFYEHGYTYVVDLDLAKYFDTVNHEILMDMVMTYIKERPIIRLIRAFLKSGVMIGGLISPTEQGTPQGGPISPLLSNVYLTRFDKWLEERGHKFVRYADDCNIYLKSQRAAERVMEHCVEFLEGNKMRLTVNRNKSEVGSPLKLKFLGFSLYKVKGKVGIRPHGKSKERFKKKVRQITKRNRGFAFDAIVLELKRYTDGWINYYGIADMKAFMENANQWIRRRLRMYIWKQWKKVSARFRNLQKLGVPKEQAWQWANTRKGYWHIADCWILSTTITNKRLVKRGYADIAKRYEVVHIHVNC